MAPSVWLYILADFGLCATVVALWTALLDRFPRSPLRGRQVLLGTTMGAGAVMAMMVPHEVAPGVLFDLRSSMVALGGFFGGPVAGLIAAAPAATYRILVGGVGVVAGCVGVVVAAAFGCFWHRLRRGRAAGYPDLAGLAVSVAAGSLLTTLLTFGLSLSAVTVTSIVLLGSAFLAVQRREELAGTNALYRAMVAALPDCLNVKDLDGRFIAANAATARLMGAATPEDLIGKSDFDFYPPELAQRYRADELAFLASGGTLVTDQPAQSEDGLTRWLSTLKAPFFDEEGQRTGIITLNRDITDRKRAELALVEARDEAIRATQAKSEFLAAMSHEIRTPMTGVLGMADLLAAESLSAAQRRYVDTIRTSGRHLLSIINDILDFSRIEAGKLELERVDFSVPEILEEVRSLLAPQAAERGLALGFALADEPGGAPGGGGEGGGGGAPLVVRGDPTRLRQVLVNLVGNGLKFTARGAVTLTVRRPPAAAAAGAGATAGAVAGAADAGVVPLRFEVRDTGIGIARARQAELFEPFVQADSSTTRHYGGSGLGLVICKRLVLAMGGAIGVDSQPGRGSCFWFEVPFARGDAAAVAQRSAFAPTDVRPLRVLVADDVPANRELLEEMLGRHGHAVRLAEDGAAAVAQVEREVPDVVLMDVQMPVMDGLEATRRIRRLPAPAGVVPILALTANVMAAERERYLAAGMDLCVTKPVVWPDLFAALASLAGGGEPAPPPGPAGAPAAGPGAAGPLGEGGAPGEGAAEPPLLDRAMLEGMARSLPAAVFGKLLRRGLDGAEESCGRLAAAAARADGDRLAQEAHRLRGTAGSFGLARVSALAGAIEDRAARGETVHHLLRQLQTVLTATRRAAESFAPPASA
jgi:PAS domain S-box-containing protein